MAAGQHIPMADLTPEERQQLRVLRKRKADLIGEIEHIKEQLQSVEGQLENLYYVDESSKTRTTMMITGRKKFNQDPDAVIGLEYLVERGLVEKSPETVAAFLFKGEGLAKSAVGDYLGSNEPFNLLVLEKFIVLHDFSNLSLVDALRLFLWSFRLPGESQKIDRIMQKFAEQFCAANPGAFDCADTCYFLAYSCIMLNTLLHNPAVKDRPNLDRKLSVYYRNIRYASMNKECIENNGVSMEIIAGIFESILKQPFRLPQDDSSSMSEVKLQADREGWLYKQGSNQSFVGPLSWKRRWFVLSEGCLYYFEAAEDRNPKGIVPLKNVGVRRVEAGARPHMMEIFALFPEDKIKACKTEQAGGRVIEGRHSNYRMAANSQDDLRAWMEAIAAAVQNVPHPGQAAPLPPPSRPRSTH